MIGTKPASDEVFYRIHNGAFKYAVISDLGEGDVVVALLTAESEAQKIVDKFYGGDAFVRELTERQSESI